MNLAGQTAQPARGWILTLARWAAAIGIVAVLIYVLPLNLIGAAIARVPVWRFLGVLGAYLLTHLIGVSKWRMVVNAAGAELDFRTSAQCYFGGLFGSLFLPSIVGGDAVRLAVGLRRSPRPAAVLAGNIVDRTIDLIAQTTLVAVGLLLVLGPVPKGIRQNASKWFMVAVAVIALIIACVAVLHRPILRGRSVRFRRRLARLRSAFRSVSRKPRAIAYAWVAGIFIQTVFLLLTVRIAFYCGLLLPMGVWLFAWPLAKLAAMAPLTQGGIGIREAALVALLAPFGAPKFLVLASALVWEGVVIAGGAFSGAILLALRSNKRRAVMP